MRSFAVHAREKHLVVRDTVFRKVKAFRLIRQFVDGKLPLLEQSETQFMSTANPTGFEFVRDAQGKVTHLMVRGAAGDQKAVRKGAVPTQPK